MFVFFLAIVNGMKDTVEWSVKYMSLLKSLYYTEVTTWIITMFRNNTFAEKHGSHPSPESQQLWSEENLATPGLALWEFSSPIFPAQGGGGRVQILAHFLGWLGQMQLASYKLVAS